LEGRGGGVKNSSWNCFKSVWGKGGLGSKFFFKMFPALPAGITYPKHFLGALRQKNITKKFLGGSRRDNIPQNFPAFRTEIIYPTNFSGVWSRKNVYLILDANLYRYKMYGTGNFPPLRTWAEKCIHERKSLQV